MAKTRKEIVDSVKSAIQQASPQLRVDVDKGQFFHLAASGVAAPLSDASSQMDRVAMISTFAFPDVVTDQEALGAARSFGLALGSGGYAQGVAYAYTSRRPVGTEALTIPEGTAFSTSSARGGLVFEATETRSLTAGNADVYFNPSTRRYELPIKVKAVSAGTLGNIAARTIVSVQQSGFDGATNLSAFRGGSDAQTAQSLYTRLRDEVAAGFDQFSRGGIISRVSNYDVDRVRAVSLTYSSEYPSTFYRLVDGQGLDIWVLNNAKDELQSESFVASSGQTQFPLSKGPVLSLTSVMVNGNAVVASLVMDTSAELGRSTREQSYVSISTPASNGDVVDVVYSYDALLQEIQADINGLLENDETGAIFATDTLVRYPKTLPVTATVTGTVLGSFDRTTVENQVTAVIADFIANGLDSSEQLGGSRNPADLRDLIRISVPGIAQLNISVFCRKSIGSLVEVVDIPRNAQAILESTADLTVQFN